MRRIIPLLIIILVACNRTQNNSYISKDEYCGYLEHTVKKYSENCQNILYKDILFEFEIDDKMNIDTSSCIFLIYRDGLIYRGKYRESIKLTNVPFCMDNNLSKINSLAFVLLDTKLKIAYKFYTKDAYYLYKRDKIFISLNPQGYKIKFDEQ